MAVIKSYTDIEQSKKLAEILPLESADMYYAGHQSIINPKEWEYGDIPKIRGKYISFDDKRIFYPCWSLAALLRLLPKSALLEKGNVTELYRVILPIELKASDWYVELVDACYEMILKLNELNLL